jgi:hypothetical protein
VVSKAVSLALQRKSTSARGADHVAKELPPRQSRAAVCELGGRTELAVGGRSQNGSGKTIRTRSLDAPSQGRNISRVEGVMDKAFIEVVRLLLESTPAIFETPHFAMKGGTAINLFIEDMPRLSVDIDVG